METHFRCIIVTTRESLFSLLWGSGFLGCSPSLVSAEQSRSFLQNGRFAVGSVSSLGDYVAELGQSVTGSRLQVSPLKGLAGLESLVLSLLDHDETILVL